MVAPKIQEQTAISKTKIIQQSDWNRAPEPIFGHAKYCLQEYPKVNE